MNNLLQKNNKKRICFSCFMVFFTLLLIMNTASSADVTRSCTATYAVSIGSISGATSPTYPPFKDRER